MKRTDSIPAEPRDIPAGGPIIAAVALILVLMICAVFMRWTFTFLSGREDAAQVPPASLVQKDNTAPPAGPAFQMYPATDLRAYRAAQEAILGSYGWVDRDRGLARIPIDRAMDILLGEER